ncbi:hypothetical protein REBECCA_210 [Erwinia phage Rebecca]|uniref:Uncharacterized protein n=1 Tax=Erwinia phage Rebecca TaxID=2530026 RepID=A0A482ID42_9CAUD|nr:hypothetical protein REBECCA_210 [Erwinia phage Rebecca]
MVQLSNFAHPVNAVNTQQQFELFTITTLQLHGGSVFHRVTLPLDGRPTEIALFAQPTKMSHVDVLRTVHDLVFLWIPPVTDPRGLIMGHRDYILNICKETLRVVAGVGSWPVPAFNKQDVTDNGVLHLLRYYDPIMDRIITQVVGTPPMDLDDRDMRQDKQGAGLVAFSPSWLDPGPFTAQDHNYGVADA